MTFEILKWDGLAKLGTFVSKQNRSMSTPALFPVVHPKLQEIEPGALATTFGYQQFITSAYLLSKHFDVSEISSIHEQLQSESVIMMDSGAYQLMLYGGVELTPEGTIRLQQRIKPDIGVIMDHPIGFTVSYKEAKERVATTIARVEQARALIEEDNHVVWTLPLQGGKYIDLLEEYLDKVITEETLQHFGFFALGSVVQVMINQEYTVLVDMIITARKKIPVTYPLHLFGAGHPAMLALATFLGCDTFDSAAYTLMARDGRYMTNFGTYQLSELNELPCICSVCAVHTPASLRKSKERNRLLAEHNLWVTQQEIREIKLAIDRGNLWELVMKRASAVPGLAKATTHAISQLNSDPMLRKLFIAGTPVSKDYAIRYVNTQDYSKVELSVLQEYFSSYLQNIKSELGILMFLDYENLNYRRFPEKEFRKLDTKVAQSTYVVSSLYGIYPLAFHEIFPTSQFSSEIPLSELDLNSVIEGLKRFNELIIISDQSWPDTFFQQHLSHVKITYASSSPFADLFNLSV